MSVAAESRLKALDAVADGLPASEALAEELFAVADALEAQPSLRRALTDVGTPDEVRAELARSLLSSRIGPDAVTVVAEAARLRWRGARALASALERQGVRCVLRMAQDHGQLDEVESELFHVERMVDAHPELAQALADRRVELSARESLLDGLVGERVSAPTRRLVRRAVGARQRTFGLTAGSYLQAAAELRARAIAVVSVARPLTHEQQERLRAALSRQVGREVNLHVVIDPAVLGGVRVSLGDEIIEGTVAARLQGAERKLA